MSQVVGNPLANLIKGVREYWQPPGKVFKECRRVLATLREIPQSKTLQTSCKQHTFVRGLQTPYDPLPEGIDYFPE
jgi:hypothetical protein